MSPVLSVEERLRLALASLDSLHRLASFSSRPHEIALFDDLAAFANTVASLTRAVRLHIDAVIAALPETCRRIAAPGHDANALQPFDRFPTYLQSDERDVFDRLDKQARAFGVLTSALDTYINDLRHFDGGTLSDMATLVRAQGQSTLQSADEIEALAQRIQHEATDAQVRAFQRSVEAQQPTSPRPDEEGGAE